jgi:hypothetical protein
MTTKTENLLTVKVISKSIAKQIRVLPVGYRPNSPYTQAAAALAEGSIQPLGSVPGGVVGSGNEVDFWLVKWENHYWWFMAPTCGALADKYPAVEQLFV